MYVGMPVFAQQTVDASLTCIDWWWYFLCKNTQSELYYFYYMHIQTGINIEEY